MFNKLFKYIGIVVLVVISFIYTEKSVLVVREYDPIMIKINENSESFKVIPVDATINENTIIPGYSGKSVNKKKSYYNMKQLGFYNEKSLVFNYDKPKNSIKDVYDKFIIKGNNLKNAVSFVVKVNETDNLDTILNNFEDEKIIATFFIDGKYFDSYTKEVDKIIEAGHTIANLGYDDLYDPSYLVWTNNAMRSYSDKFINYCINEEKNIDSLDLCKNRLMYTISPNIVVSNGLIDVKDKLSAGSIISIDLNDKTVKQISSIITLVESKGYTIMELTNHLSEAYIK